MEPIVTLRTVVFGAIIFIGVSTPILVTHFSREPDARLTPLIVGGIATVLWAIPVVDFFADQLTKHPDAAPRMTAEPTNHAPLYELSPVLFTWIVEPALVLGASLLLGIVGFIFYEVIHTRGNSNGSDNPHRGQ